MPPKYVVGQSIRCTQNGVRCDGRVLKVTTPASGKTMHAILLTDGRNWFAGTQDLEALRMDPGHYAVVSACDVLGDAQVVQTQQRSNSTAVAHLEHGATVEVTDSLEDRTRRVGCIVNGHTKVMITHNGGDTTDLCWGGWVPLSSLKACAKGKPSRLDELLLDTPFTKRRSRNGSVNTKPLPAGSVARQDLGALSLSASRAALEHGVGSGVLVVPKEVELSSSSSSVGGGVSGGSRSAVRGSPVYEKKVLTLAEKEEEAECTFKPKTNPSMVPLGDVFERLVPEVPKKEKAQSPPRSARMKPLSQRGEQMVARLAESPPRKVRTHQDETFSFSPMLCTHSTELVKAAADKLRTREEVSPAAQQQQPPALLPYQLPAATLPCQPTAAEWGFSEMANADFYVGSRESSTLSVSSEEGEDESGGGGGGGGGEHAAADHRRRRVAAKRKQAVESKAKAALYAMTQPFLV